ncbi:unnamed protein product [Didymodactylos carnosus]|uniref:Uncharacterized protein n=1 Tax=Didymodactylos carnosus TaxID=1234261 RepID=A0A813YQ40_9BILA|nr:unnamed protein product [Didymodactylos carnosus]CAF0888030.1 unnamed protein product [Didymodactylos carnosus]CAF3510793.1 unnamed protein product [Didymodactylos carnosus]CAF3672891.1 unnamed protein product [Didymodactylos carnosus]
MIETIKILDYLVSKSIIQQTTISRIIHTSSVPEDRNRALLNFLLTCSEKVYYSFIEALYLSGNHSLVKLLEPNFHTKNVTTQLNDEHDIIHRSVNIMQQNLTTTTINEGETSFRNLHVVVNEISEETESSSQVDDIDFQKELPMGFLVRLLLPDVIEQYPYLNPSKRKNRCYRMTNNPRGQCLLINNVEDFKTMEKRYGSDFDASKLKSLFQQMGFNVIVRRNLKSLEMESILNEFAKSLDQDPGDCSIVIILSHGGNGRIYGVDERYLDIDRQIINVFDDHFIGKPKIFIFQACRGGQCNYRSDVQTKSSGLPDSIVDQSVSSRMMSDHSHIRKVAKRSDMVIWHSTIKDYVSWRLADEGSIFIQTLITVFATASWCYDLAKMAGCKIQQPPHSLPHPHGNKSRSISRYFLGARGKRYSVDNNDTVDIKRYITQAGIDVEQWIGLNLFRDDTVWRRYLIISKQELFVGKLRNITFKIKHRIELSRLWLSEDIQNPDGTPSSAALSITTLAFYDMQKTIIIGWPIINYVAEFDTKQTKDLWFQTLNSFLQLSWQLNNYLIERCRIVVVRNYEQDQNNSSTSVLIRKIIGISPSETTRDVIQKCIDAFHLEDLVIDNYVLLVNCISTTNNHHNGTMNSITSNSIPLIGHEYPYAIKMKHLKSTSFEDDYSSHGSNNNLISSNEKSLTSSSVVTTTSQNNILAAHDFELRKRDMTDGQTKKHRFFPKRKTHPKELYPKQQFVDDYVSSSASTPTIKHSLFGQPLEQLVLSNNNELPNIIMHLLELLYNKGPDTTGIFRKVANSRSVKECIDKIERNVPIDDNELHPILAAGLFKHFLRTLPQPVFNSDQYDNWKKCLRLTQQEKIPYAKKWILSSMPNANYILLKGFISVLQRIAHFSDTNGMTPFNLGLCVSNSLFKTESTTITRGKQEADVMSSIVEFLIHNCVILFGNDILTCIQDKRFIINQQHNHHNQEDLSNQAPPTASSIESLDEVESSPYLPVVNRSRDSGLAASDQPFNDDSSEISEHILRTTNPLVNNRATRYDTFQRMKNFNEQKRHQPPISTTNGFYPTDSKLKDVHISLFNSDKKSESVNLSLPSSDENNKLDWTPCIVSGNGCVLNSLNIVTNNNNNNNNNNNINMNNSNASVVRRRSSKSKYFYKPSNKFLEREKLTKINMSTSDESDNNNNTTTTTTTTTLNANESLCSTRSSTTTKLKRSKSLSRHSSLGSAEYQLQQQNKKTNMTTNVNDVKRTSSLKQFYYRRSLSSDDADEDENNDDVSDREKIVKQYDIDEISKTPTEQYVTTANDHRIRLKMSRMDVGDKESDQDGEHFLLTRSTYNEQQNKILKYQQQLYSVQPQNIDLKVNLKSKEQDTSSSESNLDLTREPLISMYKRLKSPPLVQVPSLSFDNEKQQLKQITPTRSASFSLRKSDPNITLPITTTMTKTPGTINNQLYFEKSKLDVPDSNPRSNSFYSRPSNNNNDGRSRHFGPLTATNQVYVMSTNRNISQPTSSSSLFMATSPPYPSSYETIPSTSSHDRLMLHSQPPNYFSRLSQQQTNPLPVSGLPIKSSSFDSDTNTSNDILPCRTFVHCGPPSSSSNSSYLRRMPASASSFQPIDQSQHQTVKRSSMYVVSVNQKNNNNQQSSPQVVLNTSVHVKPSDLTPTNSFHNEEHHQSEAQSYCTSRRRPCHRQNALRYKSIDNENQNIEHSPRSQTPRNDERDLDIRRISRSSIRTSDHLQLPLSPTTTSSTTTTNRIYSSDNDYSYMSRYQSIERRSKQSPSFDDELKEISWSVKEKAKLFEKQKPHSQTSRTHQQQKFSTGRENYV